MKIASKKVTKVTIGKNEAGNFEYQDTSRVVEMGEQAFTVSSENPVSGETETLYFTEEENAKKYS